MRKMFCPHCERYWHPRELRKKKYCPKCDYIPKPINVSREGWNMILKEQRRGRRK